MFWLRQFFHTFLIFTEGSKSAKFALTWGATFRKRAMYVKSNTWGAQMTFCFLPKFGIFRSPSLRKWGHSSTKCCLSGQHCYTIDLSLKHAGAQPRLKSWGGPRFGSQHRGAFVPRPAKGRAGCWVWEEVVPSRCEGTPGKFLKTKMLNPAFWWLYLLWNFLLFGNYGQEVGGTKWPIHCWSPNLKVGDQSPPVPTVVAPMAARPRLRSRPD